MRNRKKKFNPAKGKNFFRKKFSFKKLLQEEWAKKKYLTISLLSLQMERLSTVGKREVSFLQFSLSETLTKSSFACIIKFNDELKKIIIKKCCCTSKLKKEKKSYQKRSVLYFLMVRYYFTKYGHRKHCPLKSNNFT